MLDAVGEVFPEAKYQRCTVHFYRNMFSVTPRSKVKLVAKMLKAIHAQENKESAREKAKAVVEQLRSMKLKEAARKVEDSIEETLTYCDFPSEHWTRIRTNNVIERFNREIRRRARVVGSFPDGNSALMLICVRLRHVAGAQWGNKKYMNIKHLEAAIEDASIAGRLHSCQVLQTIFQKILDTTDNTKPSPDPVFFKTGFWRQSDSGALSPSRDIQTVVLQHSKDQPNQFSGSESECAFVLELVDLFEFEFIVAPELGVAFSHKVGGFQQVVV